MITSYKAIRAVLLFAFLLIPFTSFRWGFAGLGEALIAVSFVLLLLVNRGQFTIQRAMSSYLFFWIFFIIVSVLGFYYNVFFLGQSSGRPGTWIFDLSSYVFIFITILMLADTKLYSGTSPKSFFSTLFLIWGLAFTILYLISFFVPTLLGAPLRYHHYFSPFVENVHQASSITCVMPFVMLFLASQAQKPAMKAIFLIFAALFVKMALDSGSTKALMGLVCGALALTGFVFFSNKSGSKAVHYNVTFSLLVLFLLTAFVAIYQDQIIEFLARFFSENDGAGARETLYTDGFSHAAQSILIGYGPGSHAPYGSGFSDAHNTILTVMLQGGILGLFAFSFFLFRTFLSVSGSYVLVGAFFSVLMYVIGGDIMRRLPIWVLLVGVSYFSHVAVVRGNAS